MSKSTLSLWFVDLQLPQAAKDRLTQMVYKKSILGLIKRNRLQTHLAIQRARLIRESARKEILKINNKELLLVGVALYWAEGYKRVKIHKGKAKVHHPVSLTNSDPFLVKIFLRFIREVCQVPEEKIKAEVRIYEHQNEGHLLEFWSRITGIPPTHFGKFYYGISKSSQGKRPYNILPYGTIQIRIGDTPLYNRIMGWIDGLSNL